MFTLNKVISHVVDYLSWQNGQALTGWGTVQEPSWLLTASPGYHGSTALGASSLCSMEEVTLAVGEIGYRSIKSATQMKKAMVLLLDKLKQVNQLVETGVTFNGLFEPVLTQPATQVTMIFLLMSYLVMGRWYRQ